MWPLNLLGRRIDRSPFLAAARDAGSIPEAGAEGAGMCVHRCACGAALVRFEPCAGGHHHRGGLRAGGAQVLLPGKTAPRMLLHMLPVPLPV